MQKPGQVPEGVNLRQRQVAQQPDPGVAGIGPGRPEVIDHVRDQHGDDVSGHDASDPVPRVAAERRLRTAGGKRFHPRPEQQKTRQHKEDRDAHLHPPTHQAEIALVVFAGGVCRVRRHHEQGGNGTDTRQRRNPVRPGDLFEAALGRRVGLGHPLFPRRGAARPPRWLLSLPRSGCRLIRTPEIRVFSSAFNV